MLLFSTQLVTTNKKGIWVFLIGTFGFLAVIVCIIVPSLMQYTGYLLVASLVGIAIGFVVTKGDVASYHMNEKLLVYTEHIAMNNFVFPFTEIKNLEFVFCSFQGMRKYSYEPDPDADLKYTHGTQVYGIDNSISFVYKGKTFNNNFYVRNQQHFFQFVQMLEQLYIHKISFTEKNWHGPTFMMNNVSNEKYRNLKRQYE